MSNLVKPLNRRQLKKINKEVEKLAREREALPKAELPGIVETGKSCSACKKGKVVKERSFDARPYSPHDIIGPGGVARPLIEEYYCNSCGVMYKFLPKK
ncbi:MAG: hypothetical protein Q8Q06_00410 [bacterium]|nr:hypothetical protein [bacterium]